MADQKLLLLDGHSLAYRAFYALPVENFATSTGQPTNAVYGFTSMLINVVRDEQPSHVAVAFDVSRETFRTKLYPEYKAQRESSPAEFKGQVELIKELLGALDIPVVQAEGFEADDVIASLATQAEATGADVRIVTGDRDVFQLVNPQVTVLYPRKGVSDLARMTPDAVVEKYGVTPAQYVDYAALRGDASDNLPGVPGVGEKTAAKWLTEYGSLHELIDHADSIGGKVGESLRANLEQVQLNRSLSQLRSDVPLDHPWQSLVWSGGSRERVDEVLEALQFRALADRLHAIRPGDEESVVPVRAEMTVHTAPLSELRKLLDTGTWAVAVRGESGQGRGVLDALAFTSDGCNVYLQTLERGTIPDALALWFADPTRPKVMHGMKSTALALLCCDIQLRGVTCDTQLAAYLLNPGQRSYALADLAGEALGMGLSGHVDEQLTLDDTAPTDLCFDAIAIHLLAARYLPALTEAGGLAMLTDMEIPLAQILAAMEYTGITVAVTELASLSKELAEGMRQAEEAAFEIVGHPFNMGSPKQLQQVLFEERGLPKTKKIKTGYTTDADALAGLFATTGDPLLKEILAYRDRTKLRQTVDGLLPLADSSHRIHTTFHQTATATGRLSSSDPNLQNIPIRTETGRRIRNCFTASPGTDGMLTADYSQIELRIMAHDSQDAALIEAFHAGEDLHTTVASAVFGVKGSDVDAEMRRQIKAMSYGLAYGLSAFGLAQQLGVPVDQARGLMDEYFARFGGVRDYLRDVVERARRNGYTETMFGRRRYLPDLNSDNRQRREMAERMALNAPIQGSAADIVKVAMLNVDRELRQHDLASSMLLQVHDELVLDVAKGEREEVEALVVSAMSTAASLSVPLDVSIGFGWTWDEAAH